MNPGGGRAAMDPVRESENRWRSQSKTMSRVGPPMRRMCWKCTARRCFAASRKAEQPQQETSQAADSAGIDFKENLRFTSAVAANIVRQPTPVTPQSMSTPSCERPRWPCEPSIPRRARYAIGAAPPPEPCIWVV